MSKPSSLTENIANNPTIFGRILRGELPCKKVFEDDQVLAFHDIQPKAPVHVLVIPKQHIENVQTIRQNEAEVVGYLFSKIPEIAKKLGLDEKGYRVIANIGQHAGNEVPHLHFHILGGERLGPMNVRPN